MNEQPHNYQVGSELPDPRPSQPMATFELRTKQMSEQWPSELDTTAHEDRMRHIKEHNQRYRASIESFERDIQPLRDTSEQLDRFGKLCLLIALVCAVLYIALELYD